MAMANDSWIKRIDSGWQALLEAVNSCPPEALARPNVLGEWSIKDLLAHVSSWEGEFLKAAPLILADQRLPRYSTTYGGIDAFNALQQERARGLSQAEVSRQLTETHEKLLAAVHSLTSSRRLEGQPRRRDRLLRRLRNDTYGHYAEHTAELRALGAERWQTS
jgi:uncharacterized damage-inducible protein DinB